VAKHDTASYAMSAGCGCRCEPAVVQWNSDGLVLAWNVGAERLLGRGAREALGRNISELFQGGAGFIDEAARRALFENAAPVLFTSEIRGPSGDATLVEWSHVPATDEKGRAVCAVSLGRPVVRDLHAGHPDGGDSGEADPGLQRRLRHEEIITRISSRFVGGDTDGAINETLREVGLFAGASRAYLFLSCDRVSGGMHYPDRCTIRTVTRLMRPSNEWRAPGIAPESMTLDELPCDNYPWLMEQLSRCESVCVLDPATLPEEAKLEKAALQRRGATSAILIPIKNDEEVAGFIGLENIPASTPHDADTVSLLLRVSQIIADAVRHQRVITALRLSEAKYRYLYEKTPIGTELYDSEGNLLEINNASREIFGVVDLSQVVGLNLFRDPNLPTDAKERLDRLESLRHEYVYDFDSVNKRQSWQTTKSGKRYTDILITKLNPESAGGQCGYMAQIEDITERKLAEQELRRERDFISNLIQTSPAYIFATATDRKVVLMNDSMLNALGYKLDEVIGKPFVESFIPEEERSRYLEAVSASWPSSKQVHIEHHVLAKDGRKLFVYWQGRRSPVGDSGETYAVVVGIDMTERKTLEEQLRQSQKMEAVGRLAGGIAHEFNNLHCGIIGYLDFTLKQEEMSEALRKRLLMVRDTAMRASDITNRLLAASRKQPPQKRPAKLDDAVADALCLLQSEFTKHGISVVTQLNAQEPLILDKGQIVQVLLNLLLNARDAVIDSPRKELTITTSLDERSAILKVADTGCGIPEAHLAHVFEPFFTTKGPFGEQGPATDQKVTGTGLGLSVCYGMIKEHGGTITVENRQGGGATFTVVLPRATGGPAVE